MSATDELRKLLDERGVEWTAPNSILCDDMTSWESGGFYYEAFEVPEPDGTFLLTAAHQDDLTPEQAIAATLGAGTCRWFELFGTPERAARTLYESTSECRCCVIRDQCGYNLDKCVMYDRDKLLEWLRGDA